MTVTLLDNLDYRLLKQGSQDPLEITWRLAFGTVLFDSSFANKKLEIVSPFYSAKA